MDESINQLGMFSVSNSVFISPVSEETNPSLHDCLIKTAREKKRRNFLDADFGVGATRVRPYISVLANPSWCMLCAGGEYCCLGPGCQGSRKRMVSPSKPTTKNNDIPGLQFMPETRPKCSIKRPSNISQVYYFHGVKLKVIYIAVVSLSKM